MASDDQLISTVKAKKKKFISPCLVVITADTCRHSREFMDYFDKIKHRILDSETRPSFYHIRKANSSTGPIGSEHPRGFNKYLVWYPIILLVPGSVFALAMKSRHQVDQPEIREGVKILDGKWEGDKLTYHFKLYGWGWHQLEQWYQYILNDPELKQFRTEGI